MSNTYRIELTTNIGQFIAIERTTNSFGPYLEMKIQEEFKGCKIIKITKLNNPSQEPSEQIASNRVQQKLDKSWNELQNAAASDPNNKELQQFTIAIGRARGEGDNKLEGCFGLVVLVATSVWTIDKYGFWIGAVIGIAVCLAAMLTLHFLIRGIKSIKEKLGGCWFTIFVIACIILASFILAKLPIP